MGKHFKRKEKKISNKKEKTNEKKNIITKKLILKLLVFIAIFLLALFSISYFASNKVLVNLSEKQDSNSNTISSKDLVDGATTSNVKDSSNVLSQEKEVANLEGILLKNLIVNFNNDVTIIKFDLVNNSSNITPTFNFNFSLLDKEGNVLTTFTLATKKDLSSSDTEAFSLLSSRDLTDSFDYTIEKID